MPAVRSVGSGNRDAAVEGEDDERDYQDTPLFTRKQVRPEDDGHSPGQNSQHFDSYAVSDVTPREDEGSETIAAKLTRIRSIVPDHFFEKSLCSVINPRAKFIQIWDVLLCVALALTATVTPYEAAFIPVEIDESLGSTEGATELFLFWMNRVLDVYFVCDFVLSFFVVAQTDASSFANPKLADNARHYARTWLTVDLVSSIPFDFIVFSLVQFTDDADATGVAGSIVELISVEMLNFLRAIRLLKLLRLFRVAKIFNRLRDTYGMSYRTTALVSSFSMLFWCCHLYACGWKLISDVSSGYSLDTWLFQVDLYDSDHFEQYTTSFYWGMMTLTTTGYGNIPPGNDTERGTAVFAMLLGAFLFTRLISRVNASGTSEATSRYRLHRDHLNDLLKLAGCDQSQAIKIRKFFRLSFCRIQHERNAAVLSQMSQRQKGTFVQTLYCTALSTMSVFQPPDPSEGEMVMDRHILFINAVSEKLVSRVYPAFEQLVCKGERTTQPTCNLYIIRRGLLGSEGRVYRANHILGEDIVCQNFERTYNINALTFVSTLTLSSIHLHEILEADSFEYQRRKIRRRSVMISVRARLRSLARMVRIINSVARVSNARPIVSMQDLFDPTTGKAIIASDSLTSRFRVETRAVAGPQGKPIMERVLVLKPEFRRRERRERQPMDMTTSDLVNEIKGLDILNMKPEKAIRLLRFYRRVREHLLFVEMRGLERKMSAQWSTSSSNSEDDNQNEETAALLPV